MPRVHVLPVYIHIRKGYLIMPLGIYFAVAKRSVQLLRGQSVLVCRTMSAPAVKKIHGEIVRGYVRRGRGKGAVGSAEGPYCHCFVPRVRVKV